MRVSKQTFWSCICLSIVVLAIGAFQARAEDWKNTIAAVVLNDRLYTVEKSGALYGTDLTTGKWVQIGKAEFSKTRFLFAGNQNLLSIETDGSLYRINPANGAWVGLGKAGEWKATVGGTFLGGKLYTADSNGGLYETNPATGAWRQIGKPDFAATRHLFNNGDLLYSIESDGSLYRIKPSDGTWSRAKEAGGWKNTMGSTVMGDKLYTVETSGVLYETSLVTGLWKPIGKAEFGKTRFLFSANGSLFTLEDGGLYRVNRSTGDWTQVG